jgi:hypothetical protein
MNQFYSAQLKSINNLKWLHSYILLFSINIFLFIFSPLFSLIFCLGWILLFGEKHINFNLLSIAIYSTLIFSSRNVFQNNSDDYIRYYSLYRSVKDNIYSIFLFYGAELFFPIFIYVLAIIKEDIGPNVLLIILTFPSFYIFISASYSFLKKQKIIYLINDRTSNFQVVLYLILVIIWGGMFSQLLRNFYSMGFIILALSFDSKKRRRTSILMAIITHFSSVYNLIIIYFEKIFTLRKKTLALYVFIFLFFGIFFSYLSSFLFGKYIETYLVGSDNIFKIDGSIYTPFLFVLSIIIFFNIKLIGRGILLIIIRYYFIAFFLYILFPSPTLMFRFLFPVLYFFSPIFFILNLSKSPKLLSLFTALAMAYLMYNIIIRTITIDENQLGIGYSIFSIIPFKWFFSIFF